MLNLHDTIINVLKNVDKPAALCLSSGVDSQALFFGLLELKKEFSVYSFTLDGYESTDFRIARELAGSYGVKFTPIYLSTDMKLLQEDILMLINKYGAKKKTDVECGWPMFQVYRNVKEPIVITGIPNDGYYCISKKGMLHYKDKIDEFVENYFSNPNAGQKVIREKIAKDFGKEIFDPYYDNSFREYLKGHTWEELNTPRQKMPIRNSFPDFEKLHNKNHMNFHKGDSNIDKLFMELLKTKWNDDFGYKSPVGLYNRISDGEITKVNV